MKIQRFRASTAQEALRQAHLAMGPKAVILQTRRVQGSGPWRFLTRPEIEVTAATDTPAPAARSAHPLGGTTATAARTHPVPAVPGDAREPGPTAAAADWQGELAALRREMASLRRQLSTTRVGPDRETQRQAVRDTLSSEGAVSPSASLEGVARQLLADLVTRPIQMQEGSCTVVALVGPTGVGKTTTIAKLAAVASRVEQKRVAFIAADTYRIGAVEQLQTYASLLELPLSVVYSLDDFRSARDRYTGYDLVLVDTVGRSPRNDQQLQELAALLEVARPDEVHLALDARGSYATHSSVLAGFRTLRPTHLLLSKLDETPRLEDSLRAALEVGLPLSYVTTGQRVPEDLAAADGAQLASWLLGGQ